MTSTDDKILVRNLISRINELADTEECDQGGDAFWHESGAKLLLFFDQIVKSQELVNSLTPKDYFKESLCPLAATLKILTKISNVNEPFKNYIWDTRTVVGVESSEEQKENVISFYELALSRCCSYISQLLGDRFHYIQKLLLKNIFGSNNVCSLFASDIYMYIIRIIHPNHRMSMCLLVMNLCRLAPSEALVKGAALINRIKHPVVNFQNPKYTHCLVFSA